MARIKKSGNMTRLLIIGSGLLGNNLAKIAVNEFTTSITYNEHPLDIEGCKATNGFFFGYIKNFED